MHLDKQGSGRRWLDLQAQFNAWDPLGMIAMGMPSDEYDCVLGPLMRMLERGEEPETIAAHLDREFVEHFGDTPRDFGSTGFAVQARRWFDQHWKGTTV